MEISTWTSFKERIKLFVDMCVKHTKPNIAYGRCHKQQ